MNGCAVVVEGSREQPTVYHANAKGIGGSPRNVALGPNATVQQVRDAIQSKVTFMENQVKIYSRAQPRALPPGQVAQQRKMLTQNDYMIYVQGQEKTVAGKGYEAEVANVLRAVAAAHGVSNNKKVVRLVNSKGTVVGFRTGGYGPSTSKS